MTVKLKTPSNGSVSLTPQDTASDVVVTVPSGGAGSQLALADSSGYTYSGGLVVSPQTGFKNRIINGDMRIDQRNSGVSVNVGPNAGAYTLDGWQVVAGGGGGTTVFAIVQDTTAPIGFKYSLKVTVSAVDSSVAAGEENVLRHNIEGFNVADLNWGTVNAQTVTLSFWVRSSVTGTFSGAIRNSAANRVYPFSYSINASNTWEYKTVTILGDTTGTWSADNSLWGRVQFDLGSGSSVRGTAGSWAADDFVGVTGAQSIVGTNGATFYITGVQLEKGSTATPFEFRSIGQELAVCQRYYQLASSATGVANNSTEVTLTFPFLVEMRATPTVGLTAALNITDTYFSDYVQSSPHVVISASRVTTRSMNVLCRNYSGLTQGRPMIANMPTGGSFTLSSEL